MIKPYLPKLIEKIRSHQQVQLHSQLRAKKWTKSCFTLLSEIISNFLQEKLSPEQSRKMGTTISSKTLNKLFNDQYRVSHPIDPRSLNTLNKLAIFVGLNDWDQFLNQAEQMLVVELENVKNDTHIKSLIQRGAAAEFEAYAMLPEVAATILESTHYTEGAAFLRVMDILMQFQAKEQTIKNHYNPSSFEILDFELLKLEERYAQVKTKEYWLLCWWHTEMEKYTSRQTDISDHFYVLIKSEQGWKIKTKASSLDFLGSEPSSAPN